MTTTAARMSSERVIMSIATPGSAMRVAQAPQRNDADMAAPSTSPSSAAERNTLGLLVSESVVIIIVQIY